MLYYVDDIDYSSANKFMHQAFAVRIKCYNDTVGVCMRKKAQLPQPQSFALSPLELDFDFRGFVEARQY